MSVCVTVDSLQLIIPEVQCEQFGSGAQAQRWRPLQAVVAQVQVLQVTQGLRVLRHRSRTSGHKQIKKLYFYLNKGKI